MPPPHRPGQAAAVGATPSQSAGPEMVTHGREINVPGIEISGGWKNAFRQKNKRGLENPARLTQNKRGMENVFEQKIRGGWKVVLA